MLFVFLLMCHRQLILELLGAMVEILVRSSLPPLYVA